MALKYTNILIIRFSAMGDVVLTLPVIKSLLKQYPDLHITVLTRPFFQTFFENIPQVTCYPVDLKGQHKGFLGLYRLVVALLKTHKIEAVFDLHNVLRTQLMGFFFKAKGIPLFKIDKGRSEKRKFVQKKNKTPLKHTTQRYQEVFNKGNFEFSLEKELLTNPASLSSRLPKIGIAPFAAHQSKQWGLDKIYTLIESINAAYKTEFYLFGGGKTEVETLEKLASNFDNVFNMAGKMNLQDEIKKMSEMSVFVSMDSSNMHLATLTGIPVISIWGGTHPDIGFSALYQPVENQIQITDLPCRPCSVFGTSTCALKENPYACMRALEVDTVVERMSNLLGFKSSQV